MIDDGVIKFACRRTPSAALPPDLVAPLEAWRARLHALGQIGHYVEENVGYGNLSMRLNDGSVLISATQTGHLKALDGRHYVRLTEYDLSLNTVACEGPADPSSEAMTHMAIYDALPAATAVFHVHDRDRFERLRDRIPTTDPKVPYGTPAMAGELAQLCADTGFLSQRLAVMAGHQDGLISWGDSLEAAGSAVLAHIA